MFEFDVLQSGLVFLLLLVLGEWVSRITKSILPAVLIAGLVYALCYWSGILPGGLLDSAGFSTLASGAMMLLIVHMGASMRLSELLANWRTVALSALSFLGQLVVLFAVVGGVFGVNVALGGLPGGTATALIVQERARALGHSEIIVLSVLFLSTQALVACPLASLCVKREAMRLRSVPKEAPTGAAAPPESAPSAASPYAAFLRLYAVAWLASRLEMLTGVSRYVLCLVLGVVLASCGLLRKNELALSKSEGFLFLLLMSTVISGFSAASPQMFAQMLLPLALVLACEIVSIVVLAALLGRPLGFSRPMSIGIGLNIMVGFPLNLLLSQEVIGHLTEDPEERERLVTQIGSKMVIGGLTSTTFLATISAGLLVSLMV
jgi:hypothetical protein